MRGTFLFLIALGIAIGVAQHFLPTSTPTQASASQQTSAVFMLLGKLLGVLVALGVLIWFFRRIRHLPHLGLPSFTRVLGVLALIAAALLTYAAIWEPVWTQHQVGSLITALSPASQPAPAAPAGPPSGGASAPPQSTPSPSPPAQATMPPVTVTATAPSPYTAECPGTAEYYDVGATAVLVNPKWKQCASIITFKGRCIYVWVKDKPTAESQTYCHTIDPATGVEKIPTLPDDVSKISIVGSAARLKVQLVPRCATGGILASLVLPPCRP